MPLENKKPTKEEVTAMTTEIERLQKGIADMNNDIKLAYEGLATAEEALKKVDLFLEGIRKDLFHKNK